MAGLNRPKIRVLHSEKVTFMGLYPHNAQYLGGLLKVKSEFWILWPKCELLIMKISGNQIKVAISALK